MRDETLKNRKLHVYVLPKILKYCTGTSTRRYQCKYAVDRVFNNKSIESMEKVGAAIKKIIHYQTIRGKFSFVHLASPGWRWGRRGSTSSESENQVSFLVQFNGIHI